LNENYIYTYTFSTFCIVTALLRHVWAAQSYIFGVSRSLCISFVCQLCE